MNKTGADETSLRKEDTSTSTLHSTSKSDKINESGTRRNLQDKEVDMKNIPPSDGRRVPHPKKKHEYLLCVKIGALSWVWDFMHVIHGVRC